MSTPEIPILINSAESKFSTRKEIRELLDSSNLLWNLVRRDLTVRYKRSVIGFFWTMLHPLILMVILTIVFANIFRFEGIEHYDFLGRISVPELEPERFYHFQFIDLYTHNFHYIGTLTTGNGAGKFLIAGPGWKGKKPEGIDAVILSETDYMFFVVRTQLFAPDDLERVKAIQDSYNVLPLSVFLGTEALPAGESPAFPRWAWPIPSPGSVERP